MLGLEASCHHPLGVAFATYRALQNANNEVLSTQWLARHCHSEALVIDDDVAALWEQPHTSENRLTFRADAKEAGRGLTIARAGFMQGAVGST